MEKLLETLVEIDEVVKRRPPVELEVLEKAK
jgi:hypothetical protein